MRLVLVGALKSFNDLREGDVRTLYMTEQVASLIVDGYLKLLFDPALEHPLVDRSDLPPGSDQEESGSGPADGEGTATGG